LAPVTAAPQLSDGSLLLGVSVPEHEKPVAAPVHPATLVSAAQVPSAPVAAQQ
jgi:hypothetical protein